MKNFTSKIKSKISLFSLLFFLSTIVYSGEGSKQTTPNVNNRASLCINHDEYGNFGKYGSTDLQRLYIRIQNPNSEKVYLGFSKARRSSPTGEEVNTKFRIMKPDGTVAFSNYTLDTANSKITGTESQKLTIAQNGPNGIDGATAGYAPIIFDPNGMSPGDYWIEFESNDTNFSRIFYNYYDITVASGTTSIPGRIYSKRWAFSMDNVNTDFIGAFFVFAPDTGSVTGAPTQNGFVNKINFNGAGFRPWYFNVAFNSSGPGTTGNTATDQKSIFNATDATKMRPEYEVFLSNPDINIWKNGTYQGDITINGITNCGIGQSNINISAYKSGTIEILLDFHLGDGIYTPGTSDVLTTQSVAGSGAPPFAVSVPWNGKNGLGVQIAQGTTIPIVVTFGQAAFHFPIYDAEENSGGYTCTVFRPTPPAGYVVKLFWDDSSITYNGGTFGPKTNLTGCTQNSNPPSNCHTWDGFDEGNQDTTQYGNRNTINTWWYANRDKIATSIVMPNFYTLALGSKTNVSCYGGNDGKIIIDVTNGTSPYKYYINGETTPNTLQNLTAGNYDIKVVDANGCTGNVNGVSITQPAVLTSSITSQTNVDCFGNASGSVTVAGADGTSPYTYSKDGTTFVASGTFASLAVGAYTITVKDAKGCIKTQAVSITQPAVLASSITSQTNVDCFGNASGSVTVAGADGTSPYTYSKDGTTFVASGTFASLAVGSYTITVKDAKGCIKTQAVSITQPAVLTSSITSQTNVDCFGNASGSVTVAGADGTSPYTYSKDGTTFVASGTFASLAVGAYTITVKDAKGCIKTQAVSITQPAVLASSITSQTNVDCFGNASGSVTVAGADGTSPYTYSKDGTTFVASGTFASLAVGAYTITVKDAKGCIKTQAVSITQPAVLASSITSQTNVDCFGNASGSVTVAGADGTSPYTYSKDGTTFVASGTFASLAVGSYTITVKDAKGCIKTQAVNITQPAVLASSITSQTNVDCFGNASGSVTVAGADGTSPYTYSKDGTTFVASGTFASLAVGAYTITVKDAKGCIKTQAVSITQPAVLASSITSQTNVDCFGNASGSVTVAGADGTSPYTYSKDGTTFVASGTFASLAVGAYTITVKDAKGCIKTQAVSITQPAVLASSITSQTNVDCFGNASGSVTVAGADGTSPYTYSKDGTTFVASGTFASLAVGAYTITVKDAKGCIKTQAVSITQPAVLASSITSQTNVDCFGNASGSVTVAGADGTSPYTYSKDGTTFVASGTFASLAVGAYTITVKDAKGCIKTQAVNITQPAVLTSSITSQTNVDCFGNASGSVTVAGADGTSPYTYSKDGTTFVASGTFASLAVGSYTITVKDAKGCIKTQAVNITQPVAALALAVSSKTDASCFGASTGSVTAGAVTGAVGTVTYSWKNASNTLVGSNASVNNLPAGNYTVTVSDSCSSQSNSVTIGQPVAALACSITQNKAVSSNGLSDGQATVTPIGGNGGNTYVWDNGETTIKALALNAGLHTVTVTDSKGCTTICNITISQPNVLSCSITQDAPAKCYGDSNGKATVTAIGGNGDYTYLWDNGETTQQAVGLNAGNHSVTVTDKLGYKTSCNVTIGQPQSALSCSITQNKAVSSNGLSDGEATVTPLGGNGGYTYLWDNGETTAKAVGLNAGSHSVTVTDSKSCKTTCSIIITQPNVLSCSITQDAPAKCYGDSNGKATVTAIGGNGEYTYLWDNGETTQQALGLNSGNHLVTITDKLGYTTSCSVTIGQPAAALTSGITLQTNVLCKGNATGAIDLAVSGGTAPYTYAWTTVGGVIPAGQADDQDLSGLVAGKYNVVITDANGATSTCTSTQSVIILEPAADLNATVIIVNNNNCAGCSNGSINITVSGGTNPYTYLWSNNATSEDISNLENGIYSVEITDKNGCKVNYTYPITESSIDITKDGNYVDTNNDGITNIGDVVSYNFVIKNTGNVTLTNVTVEDNNATIAGGPIASLAVGATDTTTFSGTHVITQADINSGFVYNLATVNAKDPQDKPVTDTSTDPTPCTSCPKDPECINCTITPLTQSPSIDITKDGNYVDTNNDGITNIGDVVSYNFVIKNTGNVTLTNVTVEDNNATVAGGPIASLAVGATDTTTFSGTHVITQADINSGFVYNLATVNAKDPQDKPVTDTSTDPTPCTSCPKDPECINCTITPLTQSPSIDITKDGNYVDTNNDGITNIGDVVSYNFVIKNTGNVTLTNVTVEDNNATVAGGPIASLAVGATDTTTFSGTHVITQADINSGFVYNLATVNAKDPQDKPVTDTSTDPTPCTSCPKDPECINCTITPLTQSPSIDITKDGNYVDTNNDGITNIGDVVSYNFVIKNTGNVTLTNVTVEDNNATIAGGPIASLAVGATDTTTFSGTHVITQADINSGFVYNLATVNAKDPQDKPVTDTSTDPTPCTSCPKDPECINCTITPLTQSPSIDITKDGNYVDTNNDGITNIGDVVSYNFVIKNTGNVTLTNVTVEDNNATIAGGPIASLAVGATDTTTFSGTHVITQADINSGFVYNLATVNAKDPQDKPVTDTSTDPTPCTSCPKDPECINCTITPLTQSPSIDITKDGNYVDTNNDGITNIGDVVSYNFVIKNTGNVTLTNVTVEDNNATIAGGPIASLAVGATDTTTFSGTHVITQADINSGFVYNLATVNAKDPQDKPVTDTSTDPTPCTSCPKDPECINCTITPLTQSPSIDITKDGNYVDTNNDGITNIGDVVSYNFVIKNTGNVTLTNVTVEDNNATVAGGPIASLAVGATDTTTFSGTHVITQADINSGFVYNLATVNAKDPQDKPVTDTSTDPTPCTSCPKDPECINCTITPLTQSPRLAVIKTATTSSYNSTGDIINYNITVTNTGNVTLHQVIVKDPLTGLDTTIAILAPGTSSEYTQSYTITQEDLNRNSVTNVATADGLTPDEKPISASDDEIVTENLNVIDAVDDNAGPIVGVDQITTNVVNVFTNDTLNTTPVIPADVILTTVTSNPFLQLNSDGSIDVLPNAPAGTLTLTYQICEKLNTTNCDTALVTVTIVEPSMTVSGESICINDVPYFSYTTTANNFTPVNGLTLTWTDSNNNVVVTMTNLPLNGKVLWPGATIDQNGNGTDWPGWLFVDGKWFEGADGFENLRPTATVMFTLNPSQTISVNYPPSDPFCTSRPTFKIDAINDTAGPIDGLNGAMNVLNVFDNDTLNTVAVNPTDVTLTLVTADPTGYITMNPNGSIDIKNGTPAGTYTLIYQICENANNGNCDTATVTINVICNNTTKISGVVYNTLTNNSPLANVPLTLTPINIVNGQNVIAGPGIIQITNAQGFYNYTGMPEGNYVLQVQDANLNVAFDLYNVTSSFLVLKVEFCKYLERNFGYGANTSPVLGDLVWYDVNNNGLQDEWYDANNDGVVTKNIPDANGNIDLTVWEWIDLNGDGSYKGLTNYGELNGAGFGNGTTNVPNLFITGPNGYAASNTMGIQGFWRVRPPKDLLGSYTVELKVESNLQKSADELALTGLVKVLPGGTNKSVSTSKTTKRNSQTSTICGQSSVNKLSVVITETNLVNKDLDFGIICTEFGAIDDVYTNINSTTTGTLGNILTNDLLNGVYVAADLVNFTLVSGSNPNITIDNLGNVTITSGLAAGTYIYTYNLCDKLNAENCVTATVTIIVTAAIIDAIADNAGPIVGVDQITTNVVNVFTNDTLNTTPVIPADVILTTVTSNPFLQLNSDGSIDVLPNAPAGTLTLTYQICEKLNTTNCDTALVTVTIVEPSMTVSGESICINDVPYFSYTTTANNFTPVNGLTLTWTDSNNNVVVTMTNLPLNGKVLWPGATIDQNGNGTDWPGWLLVDGKWFEGADGFENLRPTATVMFTLNPSQTISVNYPPSDPFCTSRPTFKIDAINDTAGPIDGINGATNVLNVFDNDTLNTVAVNPTDVTLTLVTADPTGYITMNPNGSIDIKNGTPAGTYTLVYQICENANNGNCDTATVTITVICNNTTKIYGVVLNNDTNRPIPNVPITLIPQNGTIGPILFRLTNAEGYYNFTGMIPGEYLVQVQDANLNSAFQLYPVNSSLFFLTKPGTPGLENCVYINKNFEYAKSELPVLGDYVWYDVNNNGLQDEWFDANNDGKITKNIPDANGSIDYSKWEWIDFNGDGNFHGPLNVGELNAAGFGNAKTANIFVTGPNNYNRNVIIGIQGFWRNRPPVGAFGDYKVELKMDANLVAQSSSIGATGLVKVIPNTNKNSSTTKANKNSSFEVCGPTNGNPQTASLTATNKVNLDIDFGISCKIFADILATNDTFNVTQCSILDAPRNALSNDLLNGLTANISDFKFKILTPIDQYIKIDTNGNITFLNGVKAGQYTIDYQVCEAINPTNCATAKIILNVAAIEPITITATSCNADSTTYDLFSFLSTDTTREGVWIDTSNSGRLQGSIFNPFELAVGDYTFEYRITTGPCPRSYFIKMNVNFDCKVLGCEAIVVHNAFSPNGDGINDLFKIDGLDDSICYPENTIEIYNRWGVLVFETKNYNSTSNSFDGISRGRTTVSQSDGLPTGTYFYILTYTSFDLSGNSLFNKKDGYLYLTR